MFDLDLGKNYLTLTLDSVVGGKIKEIQHKQSRTEIQYENSPGYPNYITTGEQREPSMAYLMDFIRSW